MDPVVSGTNADDAASRLRSLYIVDRFIRRDLPAFLCIHPRLAELRPITEARIDFENLPVLADSRAAGLAVSATFRAGQGTTGSVHRAIHSAWVAACHVENGLVANRTYQLGSAGVYAFTGFIMLRDDSWVVRNDAAKELAIALLRETATKSTDDLMASLGDSE